jgi:PilZ domain
MSPHLLNSVARRSERVALNASVSLRRSGQLNYRVRIFDASLHGCRVEFVERPSLEEQLWVKFDGLQPLEAEVCWIDGFMAGVNFRQPIHPAVFDRLVAGA